MKNILNFIMIFLFALFVNCHNTIKKPDSEKKKIITVFYNGCSSESEIISDLEQSIKTNKSFLTANGIQVKIDTVEMKCGYLLLWNNRKKEVPSVLTDLDFQQIVKDFYKIK